jgi:hypothetical protein
MPIDLPGLSEFHSRFPDSIHWKLTPSGLLIEGEAAPIGSGGPPTTMRRVWTNFGGPIQASARERNVPCEIILATIGAESSGNPDAVRHEPGYVSDDATPAKVSIGLMQTLVSTARAALNDPHLPADALRDPATSIRAGTAYIDQQARDTRFDPPVVACAYNAGSVRHNGGANNRWKMTQYPIGTSEHADRWVKWFNDCFLLFADAATRPDANTPSFNRLLNPAMV